MNRLPSVDTLRPVFGKWAHEARRALGMTRAELEATSWGAARVRECFHPPETHDIRLTVLGNMIGADWETFHTRKGETVCYLNTGDTYSPTLILFRGRYRVGCWGDIAERHGTSQD